MASITLTLKLPFLSLNRNRRDEFERLTALNTDVANSILSLPRSEKKLSSKDFAQLEIGSAAINQTIRNASAETKVKKFRSLPLEINNQNWKLKKVGETYSVEFNLTRDRSKRLPVRVHESSHREALDKLLGTGAQAGTLKVYRSRKGIWYVLISISMDVPEKDVEYWIGLDRGQRCIAVASNFAGQPVFFSYQVIRQIRRHYQQLRRRLQKRGLKGVIKRIEKKESRLISHINHIISKAVVSYALANNAGIRLEDLSGIRRSRQSKKCKSDAGGNRDYWPYFQLEQYIIYKAKREGVPLERVPAAYTSLCCNKCKHVGRRRGDWFYCENCGYQGHADHNASRNIGMWEAMACLIGLQEASSVMDEDVQRVGVGEKGDPLRATRNGSPSAPDDSPQILVNTQQVIATATAAS
jgi:putative transposase